jgi:hypothetical protein
MVDEDPRAPGPLTNRELEVLMRGLLTGISYRRVIHALVELCHADTQEALTLRENERYEKLQELCSRLTRAEHQAQKEGL